MGRIVIAAFRPHPGKEDELLSVIRDRLPLLRRLGMATDRQSITMRAGDGAILEISEWVDDAAIERAHAHPEVLALWERFEACSEYVGLRTIDETAGPFPTFSAVEAPPA